MTWRRLALSAALVCAAATAGSAHAADGSVALAIIDISPRDGGLEIEASALALTAAALTGEMKIDRRGRAGTVSTSQSRELDLQAGQTGDIARTGVSFVSGDSLAVTVTLRQGGIVVAESTTTAGPK